MSRSGYTACPCCSEVTISDDTRHPELCELCEEAGCDEEGEGECCQELLPEEEEGCNHEPE